MCRGGELSHPLYVELVVLLTRDGVFVEALPESEALSLSLTPLN